MRVEGTWADQTDYGWYTAKVLEVLSGTRYAYLVQQVQMAFQEGGKAAAVNLVKASGVPKEVREAFYRAIDPKDCAKYNPGEHSVNIMHALAGGYIGDRLSSRLGCISIEGGEWISTQSLEEGPFGLLDQHLRNLRLGLYCEKTGKGRDSLSFSIDDVRVFQSRPGEGSWKIFVNTRDMTVTATPGLKSSDLVAAIETTYASEFSRAFDYVGEFGGGYPKGLHTLEDAWKVCQAMGVQNVTKKSLTTSYGEMPISDINIQQVSDEVDRKDGFGPRKVYKFGCEMQGVTPSSVLQHVLVLVKVFGRKLKVVL